MQKIKIDDKEYELTDLTEEEQGQLASLQFVAGEINRLKAQLAVLQTASMAYSRALKEILESRGENADTLEELDISENIRFDDE